MIPIQFDGANITLAKNQPEYRSLPAHVDPDDGHIPVTACWSLSFRERLEVLFRGVIWHQQLTFGQRYQPAILTTKNPIPGCDSA